MTIVVGSVVILLTLAVGVLLAFVFTRLDTAVNDNNEKIEVQNQGYNSALTMGFAIDSQAPPDVQIAEARRVSAKLAASLPRGGNARIGYSETPGGKSASKGLDYDPWTASKIAQFHGWDGAKNGIPAGGVPEAAAVAAPAAASSTLGIEAPKLIEITDDMSPEDTRKARVANSKAKSAFNKALKAAGIDPKTVEFDADGNVIMPQGAAAAAAPAAAPSAPAAVNIEAPEFIEITDDMSPEDTRKARVANSKAKSAFNKALKAAGIDPKTVEIDADGKVVIPQAVAAAPATEAAQSPAASPAKSEAAKSGAVDLASLGISPPELIQITDDMSPDDKRQARIANSKAKSAFNKELKAAGIDPKSVTI